jgi:Bacterial Ig-like domain (group 3)
VPLQCLRFCPSFSPGTVSLLVGATQLGTARLGGTGTATFTIACLSVEAHAITAVYVGDGNFTASTSAAINQGVNLASNQTSAASSVNSSTAGESVTFTATIAAKAPGSDTPTGTVAFLDGSTTPGTVSLSGGTARFTTSTLPAGTNSITAAYTGDSDFKISTSAVLRQVVKTSASDSAISLPGSVIDQVVGALQEDAGTDRSVICDLTLDNASPPSLRSRTSIRRRVF